ncbi:MAG TPA: hypothetical protein VKV17_19735 [Bryobacteraceae bacterium]|nr:hypothetical protein [Bryobacteraceae bacterium]
MSEELFRNIVAVAVTLACIAFVVQSIVVIALFVVLRKMQQKVATLIEMGDAVTTRAMPVIDKMKPLAEQAAATLEKVRPVLEKAVPVVEKAGPAVDKVTAILASTHLILEENRPRIAEMSTQAAAIVRSGREQVDHLGSLLDDASTRARARIAQIDRSVDHTVEQVEQVGENVRRAAMRPVREANAIGAAISAAVSTLIHGSRRSSVEHATQDEEMFI